MDAELLIYDEQTKTDQSIPWSLGRRVVFGRDAESPVVLENQGVSRHHFSLEYEDGHVWVVDLSNNGTSLNGDRIQKRIRHGVQNEGSIEVPGYRITVRLPVAALEAARPAAIPATGTTVAAPPPASKFLAKYLGMFTRLELTLAVAALLSVVLTVVYLVRESG